MTEQTPREIDTQLAALYADEQKVQAQIARLFERAHRALGERQTRSGRRWVWPTRDEAAMSQVYAESINPTRAYTWDKPGEIADEHTAAVHSLAGIRAQMREYDAQWRARGWSRFFLVTSSSGGHIHSSMACSTCTPTTTYGWLPDLSGKTEADAVAEQGPRLCSICFPTAPVEWTVGKPKPERCPGSGQAPTFQRRQGMTFYGGCPECQTVQTVTQYGAIRAHKPAAK